MESDKNQSEAVAADAHMRASLRAGEHVIDMASDAWEIWVH